MSDPGLPVMGEDQRVCELVGDRACAKCCFNLAGQPVLRERHYGMLIARCPECGTPAALQEYPLLGRWATRFGYLIAGVWLAAMIAIVSLAALVVWRLSEMMTQHMASPYTVHVQKVWNEYVNGSGPPNPYAYSNYTQNQRWWEGLDKAQLFRDAGGWGGAVSWSGLWFGVNMVLAMGSIGCVLAVVMPHVRWKSRVVLAALIGVLATAFAITSALMSRNMYSYYGGVWMAWRELYPVLFGVGAGISLGCLLLGMWTGRAIARGLVVLLLPPRLRGPLAYLWRADGKPLPKMG